MHWEHLKSFSPVPGSRRVIGTRHSGHAGFVRRAFLMRALPAPAPPENCCSHNGNRRTTRNSLHLIIVTNQQPVALIGPRLDQRASVTPPPTVFIKLVYRMSAATSTLTLTSHADRRVRPCTVCVADHTPRTTVRTCKQCFRCAYCLRSDPPRHNLPCSICRVEIKPHILVALCSWYTHRGALSLEYCFSGIRYSAPDPPSILLPASPSMPHVPVPECLVCMEPFDEHVRVPLMLTPCGHSLCARCNASCITPRCPTCRAVVQNSFKNFEVLKFVTASAPVVARPGIVSLAVAAARAQPQGVAARGGAWWEESDDIESFDSDYEPASASASVSASGPVPDPVAPAPVPRVGVSVAHARRNVCKRQRGESSGVGEWECAFCSKTYKYDGSCVKHERSCRSRT